MVFLWLLLLGSGAVAPGETELVWQALRGRYLGLQSLSGSFHETICSEAEGTCTSFEGSFAVRLPGHYRMEVTSPQSQLIVGSDSVLWFHFPDENRAVSQPGTSDIPMLAFLGPVLDTTTTAVRDTNHTGTEVYRVITPEEEMSSLFDLELELDQADTRIAAFSFNDAWGNHYHFRLTGQQWNPKLPDTIFEFTPPEGTEVE